MNRDRAVELAAKFLASVLFVLSVGGLVTSLQGGEDVVTAVFGVYLTGLLLAGVFRDATDRPGWQVAFFSGVAVWGGYEYVTTSDTFALLLAVVGVVMVAANALNLR